MGHPHQLGKAIKPSDPAYCRNPSEVSDENIIEDLKQSYLLYKSATLPIDANKPPVKIVAKDLDQQIFEPSPKTSIVRSFPFSGCSFAINDNGISIVDPDVSALNLDVKKQLSDQNRNHYSLVGAVWLDDPKNPNSNRGFRKDRNFEDFELGGENRLSSMSMETYTQIDSPNCFSCHDTKDKGGLAPKLINVSHVFKRFAREKRESLFSKVTSLH